MNNQAKVQHDQEGSSSATAISDSLPKPTPRHHVGTVAYSLLFAYLLVAVFAMQSIHHWAKHLPASNLSENLIALTGHEAKKLDRYGLLAPEKKLESWFSDKYTSAKDPLFEPRDLLDEIWPSLAAHKRKISPIAPETRALLIGDSLMATVGPTLRTSIVSEFKGQANLVTKVGTGLARPDFFDWQKTLRDTASRHHYDAIFIMLGTNDGQSIVDRGAPVAYGTRRWVTLYRERLNQFMTTACSQAKQVYWLGLPPMRENKLHRKAELINILVRNVVAKHDCMQFISLKPALVDDDGSFTAYVRQDHQDIKVRSSDGIHFTHKGSQMVANYVLKVVRPVNRMSAKPDLADARLNQMWRPN
ncbi:MAG: DUF459 domain-containing protein [Deltaproteobacteria bacterium]|nr:DUF459 domain-containing protein [Deltaproteobacteria bacterium]